MCKNNEILYIFLWDAILFIFVFLNINLFILIGGWLLYNIVLVLPYINMNPPRVYMCSPFEPRSHLSPHTIPLGHSSAPAQSILYHASNLDWWFTSYMTLYMFQCHSPKSSHPLPLPQSPKDCSIHLCLLLSLIQGYCYHLSKFYMYALVYCIDVFLSGLLHCIIGSSYIHLIRTDSNVFFLVAE